MMGIYGLHDDAVKTRSVVHACSRARDIVYDDIITHNDIQP